MRSSVDELDLREVRAFVAVVEAGSFLAAARRLSLSQPTISLQVQRMESQLGASLLHRERGGCRPTAAGSRLLPHARRLLESAARARHALDTDRIVLGASSNIGIYHLPEIIAGLPGTFAASRVALRIGPHAELLDALARGLLDVALTEWWDGRAGFHATPWHREPLLAIVPPGHALSRARSVTLERLFNEPLIGGEPGTGTAKLIGAALGSGMKMPPVRHAFGSTEGVKRAVAAGLGVSLVLRSSCHKEVVRGSLHALRIRDRELAKTFHAIRAEDSEPTELSAMLESALLGHHGSDPAGTVGRNATRSASVRQRRPPDA